MRKVIWLSKHEMTQDQKDDLRRRLHEDFEVECINHTWAASCDYYADIDKNVDFLKGIFGLRDGESLSFAYVAGVFPPVAMEALRELKRQKPSIAFMLEFHVSVCMQTEEERSDGKKKIAFRHARWSVI